MANATAKQIGLLDGLHLVAMALGCALWLPMLRQNALFWCLAGHDDPGVATQWYGLFLAACIVAAAIIAVRCRQTPVKRPVALLSVLFIAQAGFKVIEVCMDLPDVFDNLIATVDTCLFAVAFVALTAMWTIAFAALDLRRALLLVSIALIASFLAVDAIEALPGDIAKTAFALFPALSALLWFTGNHDGPPPANTAPPLSRNDIGIFAVVIVFLLASDFIRGALSTSSITSMPPIFATQLEVATIALSAILAIACLIQCPTRQIISTAMFISIAIVFTGLLLNIGTGSGLVEFGRQVVIMGRTCLILIFWSILVDLVRVGTLAPFQAFGICFIPVNVLASLLGYIVAPQAIIALGATHDTFAVPLACTTAFVLVIAMLLLIRGSLTHSENNAKCNRAEHGGAFQPSGLFAEFDLTPREEQVAELFAMGNSQKRTAEILGVTIASVQNSAKVVYRKLGIHSRQELVDLKNQHD